MHELLKHVLNECDLTRAGDIFAIPDADIVDDLNDVLKQITEISSRPDYIRNDREQALIEICVTRVTSCIKETSTLDKYCPTLVALLESCLHHNLMPVGHLRDDDPPHAKIASDIISCIVLVSFPVQADKENYDNTGVMELFLPVAVQFLHKGNREISRHMARYLSLAAAHHAALLKPHVHTIMDSIMSGNYPLCRILTNLYEVCPEPLEGHATALVSLLPHAEQVEKNSLFSLFEQIAARKPEALKTCIPQLLSYLCPSTASQNDPGCMCVDILQLMYRVSVSRASLLSASRGALRRAGAGPHARPAAVTAAARALTQLGLTRRERAQEALSFVLERLAAADAATSAALLRDATALCSAYPALFTDSLLTAVRNNNSRPKPPACTEVNRTSGGVTIVKLGGAPPPGPPAPPPAPGAPPPGAPPPGAPPPGYGRRAKLGDSRSTGRLHTPAPHRPPARLNLNGGSVGGLHKSMTRLSSSQQINSQQNTAQGANSKPSSSGTVSPPARGSPPVPAGSPPVPAGSPPVPAGSPARAPALPARPHHNIVIGVSGALVATSSSTLSPQPQSISVTALTSGKSTDILPPVSIHHSNALPVTNAVSIVPSGPVTGVTVTSRRANNTSVTMINGSNSNSNHRISVFEPYPMRDTVQHFCEKHLDKIKAYMDNVSLRLPPPAKCTIEERRSKKQARLSFACGRRGAHCLFAGAGFGVRTRAARVWIHLMFLALQARHAAALSSRDPTVASLRHCWDILKCDNNTFLTLVTSAFPGPKDQETVEGELRAAGLFDVLERLGGGGGGAGGGAGAGAAVAWGCSLCARPERALPFLAEQPLIEGRLKEKKGRWRLFRRWRTRYFTLSGAHLSCKGASGGESIDINQIRSVKVSRGARNIPKAFEIFTGDATLLLKPTDASHAEQWAQCLSVAVARSHARLAPDKR